MFAGESRKDASIVSPNRQEAASENHSGLFQRPAVHFSARPSHSRSAGLGHRLARAYARHPRSFWAGLLSFMFLFVVVQSFLAQPRPVRDLFHDVWDLSLLFFPMIYLIFKNDVRLLLIAGLVYLALSSLMWVDAIRFIKPAYGTLFFICALWFVGDWFNTRRFGKSVFSELLGGNYYLALGIFLATVVVGAVVEIANIPFRIWWYQWPFPSLEILGLPVIMIAFGWLPWVLAMFVVLYPFALQEPQKLS